MSIAVANQATGQVQAKFFIGSGAPVTTTLTASLTTTATTTLAVAALPAPGFASGHVLTITDGAGHAQNVTVGTAATTGAVSVTVTSFTPTFAFPSGSSVIDDSSVTYSAVAAVRSLKGPGSSRATIEVTSLDSQGNKEYIVGLNDGGTVDFTIDYTPTAHEAIRSLANVAAFQIQLPGVSSTMGFLRFNGVVTKFQWDFDETKQLTADVEIQVTGPVTYTLT